MGVHFFLGWIEVECKMRRCLCRHVIVERREKGEMDLSLLNIDLQVGLIN